MKNKILITGASGFIGTNLLDYLKERYDVLNIDNKQPLRAGLFDYWHQLDITDLNVLEAVVRDFNPDYIVHLAARTDLQGNSIEDYSANTIGVHNILTIAQKLPKLKKIIITSSMLVCRSGYVPKDQFDYAPTTIYGESKVLTEKIVWDNKPQCDWAIVRPSSIWGPWFGEPYKNFFDMVIAKRYFHVGKKSCTKTYGYVGNVVYQIEQILFADTTDANNKVFYLGDTPATNIEEWANEIATELGYKIHRIPYWLLKCAAWGGDILKLIGIRFPMTSFRLENMTTNNIVELSNTNKIAPNLPYSRIEGVKRTLSWIQGLSK